jgi:hypothetical protein
MSNRVEDGREEISYDPALGLNPQLGGSNLLRAFAPGD